MAPLDTPMAMPAAADVDVELPVDRPAGNLDLVLLIDVRLGDGAAAIRAGMREWRFVNLINLLGR